MPAHNRPPCRAYGMANAGSERLRLIETPHHQKPASPILSTNLGRYDHSMGRDGGTLELDGLTTGYDRAPVVRDLTLTVAPGEVVALLGANGAGKTTTLRAISGLVKPMAGRIRL